MDRNRRLLPNFMRSVRMRTTLATAVIVACALTLGGFAFVTLLRSSLTGSAQDAAEQRAETVVKALRSGSSPREVTSSGEEELFVQIIDAHSGTLVANSDPRLTSPVRFTHPGQILTIKHIQIADGDHTFRVVERDARSSGHRVHVVVGASLEHVAETTHAVRRMLLYGIPALLLLVAATSWMLTERALRPVEMIRRQVSDISAQDLDDRVRVPATGDEIAALAGTMNEMLGRLADSSLRERHFISDASHELRSPITTIRNLAEVAEQHPESTDVRELARTVLTEEKRLEKLVDDLLVLARADEHTLALARQPIDLDDLVFDEAARLRNTSVLLVDTSNVSPARIRGDAGSLRRALGNLADNAVRHARSRITFELSSDGNTATVVVLDDGDGVPEQERGRIFERFTRLGTARDRDSGGSGLGLSIVTEIMKAHEGQVSVSGAPGAGARFELRLPIAEAGAT
jgi:signal transduction histidine kinase